MVMGIDPRKIAAVQEVSKFIKGVITVNYEANTFKLKLSTMNPESAKIIDSLLDQFSGALAQQLSAFFAIDGEIVEVGKPSEESKT